MNKVLALLTLTILFLVGCSEPKADAEKLNHANAVVNMGKFDEGMTLLEAIAKVSPNDPALKQSLISGHMKFANYYMYNDSLPPKIKYPNALKHYRAVLKLDATNVSAKENADMIIGIYKSMGREVPAEQ